MLLKKEKETQVKFSPGFSANRPSNNWTQIFCGTPSLGAPACSLRSAVCGLRSAVCGLQSAVCKCHDHTPQNRVSQPKSHIGKPFTMRE